MHRRDGISMFVRWITPLAVAALLVSTQSARALVIAADDASQSPYNDGWQNGDNGGNGYQAWTSIGNQSFPTGSGGGFISTTTNATDANQSQIGSSSKSWGMFGNG